MNITPNKLTIAQLFATPNEQFIVPSYQRRYAWGHFQYSALFDDIAMLKDDDGHLFGMIILHTGIHTGGINQPELVDGQQRMTTLVILLKAFENVYRLKDKIDKANEIRKMILCKDLDELELPKIKLGDLDNNDFHNLVFDIQTEGFTNKNIEECYSKYYAMLSNLSIEEVNKVFFKLTNIAVIIRLDVGLAKDAYKLFETINNRGLKLTPTDIIKNFLLGHAAKIDNEKTLNRVKELWHKILTNLDNIDTDDFLRQFMCSVLERKITMNKLVSEFKKYYLKHLKNADLLGEFEYYQDDAISDDSDEDDILNNDSNNNNNNNNNNNKQSEPINNIKLISIVEFLENLELSSHIYRKIYFAKHDKPKINRSLNNLNKIFSKPSYIFLIHFLENVNYSEKDKLNVLRYIESLMLRRHICEKRTSENDDIFSKLVSFVGEDNILEKIKNYIKEEEHMPNDVDFEISFSKHQFKGRLVDRAKYVLESIENFKRGDTSELEITSFDEVHLEHIIPQTIDTKKSKDEFGDWITYLGDKSLAKHKKYVNYIGNMTLLGESLNIQAYNNPFAKKKNSYRKSNFIITNELVNQNDFKFTHVDKRGEKFAEIALKIWKA